MRQVQRFFMSIAILLAALGLIDSAIAAAKAHHQNGQQLLGERIKKNGNHAIHKKGPYAASVEVKDGKVAGVRVKHAKKGEVPVKKYKSSKKMANTHGLQYASFELAQYQDLGMTFIGYAYVDEYGDEVIYWFPYEMILDGDTGAIEYVALS